MDLNLAGKTAVVTGASKGIGLAIVQALIAEGVKVVGAARTVTPELADSGAIGARADLATAEGVQLVADRALAELGAIDLLVNNVGGASSSDLPVGDIVAIDDTVWQQAFDLTFLSAVRMTRALLPSLLQQRGVIVNVSSMAARVPSAGAVSYATAKAALTAFSRALAEEVGPQGVRVNTVSPGPVRTTLWDSSDSYAAKMAAAAGISQAELLASLPAESGITLGRLGAPAEVADLIVYLASPRAAFITGADYLIDGGAVKTT
ncbi:oxidoreductase [Streptomyces sp. NPDC059255]|uniref:oxidoreductase n=1 Tax=Streptomyces sp. NPDC059255 TaxID=3346793 RepID=UPI0036C4FAD9